jgi:WD40 repeat protein
MTLAQSMAQTTPLRLTPVNSPISRLGPRSPQKLNSQSVTLSLQSITGTTSRTSGGLASHYDSNTFAYCAGSAAVLATVDENGETSCRFFRAQPTASPIHSSLSFYNPSTPTQTSESRRRSVLPLKHGVDERPSYNSPRKVWGDDASSKTWSARERVKAATCVAVSANGKFLAVGETGYCPRVNIFSTMAGASSDVPLTILNEHSFGVRSVAFSPDSKWLATLGDATDGFLFIWSINPKTGAARLQYSNKCTASVLDMAWCGNNLITVGTRYVKVWRIGEPPVGVQSKQGRQVLESEGNASPTPKILSGRNSLLGFLVDSTFTCAVPISDHEAVLCTKEGSLCLLDDSSENQELRHLKQMNPPVQALAVDRRTQQIWFSNSGATFSSETFESLRKTEGSSLVTSLGGGSRVASTARPSSPIAPYTPCRLSSSRGLGTSRCKKPECDIASTCLPNKIVSIDGVRQIRIEQMEVGSSGEDARQRSKSLPAHNDAVLGVVSLPKNDPMGHYLTWSPGGSVNFWCMNGSVKRQEMIELEQPQQFSSDYDGCTNELKLVRISADGQFAVSGDKLGVLQVLVCQSWTSTQVRAHSADITDMALSTSGDSLLVATSSRDRTVQLFQYADEAFEILQTCDDHIGTVIAVAFADDYLISASSDRTVIVRQRTPSGDDAGPSSLRYVSKRVITLKAAPTSITFAETYHLVVATIDRQISTFNITTGTATYSFKAFDSEGEDAVTLSSLKVTSVQDCSGTCRILAGFSSADKSIRLYDLNRGVLLARELGHTEGVSDVAVLDQSDESGTEEVKVLVSTGFDGLIMVWHIQGQMQTRPPSTPLRDLQQGQAMSSCGSDGSPLRESILKRPPLRKVLSKLDLVDRPGGGQQSPSSRDPSPTRLKRKTSRLAMAPRIHEGSSTAQSPTGLLPSGREVMSFANGGLNGPKSPSSYPRSRSSLRPDGSPPSPGRTRVTKVAAIQENPGILCIGKRSPSPESMPQSIPENPKGSAIRVSRGHLRRPPSVPVGLNSRFQNPNRRKSMSCGHDSGSIGIAGEQICRALQAYRRKILAAPATERAQAEAVEVELLATIRAIQERRQEGRSRENKSTTMAHDPGQ